MEIEGINFVNFNKDEKDVYKDKKYLFSDDDSTYIVPIFQREYSWGKDQIKKLIDDAQSSALKKVEHYCGTIVALKKENSENKYFLIDGQQRIMTVFIILKTINLFCSSKEGEEYKKIYNFTNKIIKTNDTERKRKVKPNYSNEDEFQKVIINPDNVKAYDLEKYNFPSSKMADAVNYILEMLNKIPDNTKSIWNLIWYLESLKSVFIVLDVEKDEDPQLIFESINASGVKLQFSDLVRNFLLMDVDSNKQEELYKKYRKTIVDNVKSNDEDYTELFFADFLSIQLGKNVNEKDLYKEFVEWVKLKRKSKEEILKTISTYSSIYKPLIFPKGNFLSNDKKNEKIIGLLSELKEIGLTSVNCFLFKVLDDYYNNKITNPKELENVLNLMVVYLVRRVVYKISSASLKKFMISLYNRIFINENDKENYYISIYAYLYSLGTDDALMPDENFVERIQKIKFYKLNISKYLLNVIQNGRYPDNLSEKAVAENLSVEHIIPQKINSEEWIDSLGENYKEKHDEYKHRLGNLSLLSGSNNSSFSNKSFKEKKRLLKINNAQFSKLNDYLINKVDDKFTFEDVDKRGKELAEILKSKFKLNEIEQDIIDNFHLKLCSLEDENEYLKIANSKIVKFTLFEGEPIKIPSANAKHLLIKVAIELFKIEEYKSMIIDCTQKGFHPWHSDSDNYFKKSLERPGKGYEKIGEDNGVSIWIKASPRRNYLLELLKKLLILLNVPLNGLKIYVNENSYYSATSIGHKKMVRWVLKAYKQLNDENVLIYNKEYFPKNNYWIKFQVKSLKDIFSNSELGIFDWDNVKNNEFFYCEFNRKNEKNYLTFQKNDITQNIVDMLLENTDLDLLSDSDDNKYYHVKNYDIHIEDSLGEDNFIKSFKKALVEIINKINDFAIKLKPAFEELKSKL